MHFEVQQCLKLVLQPEFLLLLQKDFRNLSQFFELELEGHQLRDFFFFVIQLTQPNKGKFYQQAFIFTDTIIQIAIVSNF